MENINTYTSLIVGISGSIRSNYKSINILEEIVVKSENAEDLNNLISVSDVTFSNSDLSLAHAMLGAKLNGSQIRLISVSNILKKSTEILYSEDGKDTLTDWVEEIDTLSIDEEELNKLFKVIGECDGVVLSTPVYFGDRSSVANKFLQLTNKESLLKGKAFGVVSVGAKRNGGQETTNIYSLYEALMQESIVVGNGPASCQYGGTVWGGDMGTALDDVKGLETCFGTGSRVSQLAEIIKKGEEEDNENSRLKITVLVTMDTPDKQFDVIVEKYFSSLYEDHDVNIVSLVDNYIYRCVACNICPSLKHTIKNSDEENPYTCIVQTKKDSMKSIRETMLDSDALILVGVNSKSSDLVYRYQAFMERTRFIRRNDFELTNIPVLGMLINDPRGINNPIHNIKVMTSFIRHNTFMVKPIQVLIDGENKVIYKDDFKHYVPLLQSIKEGRKKVETVSTSYKAEGYSDKRLDETDAKRK